MFNKKEKQPDPQSQMESKPVDKKLSYEELQKKSDDQQAQIAQLQGQLVKLSGAYNSLYQDYDLFRERSATDAAFIAKLLTRNDPTTGQKAKA